MIAYHEFMWELLSCLVDAGLLARPSALGDHSPARVADLHDLVYLVQTGP